jgi:dihydroorotate dehydrogenase electron transfer subunit
MMSEGEPATRRRGTFAAEVAANERLCAEHYLLRLRVAFFPPTRPGQFVQLQCCRPRPHARPRAIDWSGDRRPQLTQADLARPEALLRRPFSLAGRRDLDGGGVELEIIYRVVGCGTAWLEALSAGGQVSVLGPLGNGFAIRDDKPAAALVAGGVGIPPMIYLGEVLSRGGKAVRAFCGVRSEHLLPLKLTGEAEVSALGSPALCAREFAAHGIETAIATDDGSLGWRGFIPEAFEQWLAARDRPAERLVVYSCGPEPMMRAVGRMCVARGVQCQLALERHMGCGMGTCQSCVFKMRSPAEPGWSYKLVCTDGPVFDAREIVWE